MRSEHGKLDCDKVDRRIASKADHPDFLFYIIKNRQGVAMPIQELYANSTLIVLAGSKSTASGLAGITFQLLKHPAALQKAVDEIRSAFTTEAEIKPEKVKRLPYLAATVSEGLRMYPPFPEGLPRVTPRQGALICGQWVLGGVGFVAMSHSRKLANLPNLDLWANQHPRRPSQPRQFSGSRCLPRAWRRAISRPIRKRPPSPFLLVPVAASAEGKFGWARFFPFS